MIWRLPLTVVVALALAFASLVVANVWETTSGAEKNASAQANVRDSYAGALRLYRAGYTEQARESARKLAATADAQEIPPELQAGWLEQWTGVNEDVAVFVGNLAFGLILALGVGALLLGLWRRADSPKCVIEDIENPHTDLKIGSDMRARIIEELDRANAPASRMLRVDGPSTGVGVVQSLPSSLKVIGPLIDWLRRPRYFRVVVYAHGPQTKRAAVSVTISNPRGGVVDSHTLRGREGETDAAAYIALSVDVAAWTLFRIKQELRRRGSTRPVQIMGARSWRSYAWYRRGVIASEASAECFHKALALDHRNVAALVELGDIQTRPRVAASSETFAAGLKHLKLALELVADATDYRGPKDRVRYLSEAYYRRGLRVLRKNGTEIDPLWYQASYKLARAYLHRAMTPGAEKKADLRNGILKAFALVQAIGATMVTLRGWRRFAIRPSACASLHRMFDEDAAFVLALYAGALAAWEQRTAPPCAAEQDASRISFEQLPDKLLTTTVPWEDAGEHALRSADLKQLLGDEAKYSRADMHYNVACYLAQRKEHSEAIDSLRDSSEHLNGEELAEWVEQAELDPSLRPLTEENARSRFAGLLNEMRRRAEPRIQPQPVVIFLWQPVPALNDRPALGPPKLTPATTQLLTLLKNDELYP